MDWVFIENEIEYDGSQLKSLWAYKILGIKEDNIVSFVGPCNVKGEHMIDLEDYIAGYSIYSPKMLHFIVEHFDEISIRLIYTRQRLLVNIARDLIDPMVERVGDDLYWGGKKLSVSIASVSPISAKIHFGINIESVGEYASLKEIGIENVKDLAIKICREYAMEIMDIEEDLRKTRPIESF
jgi:hypothetical protein